MDERALETGPGSIGERMLQEELGSVDRAENFYRYQVLDHLNPRMQEFVAEQELVFIATADAGGACDASLRAGPPGFVRVEDATTLSYPDYRGNGVMASLGNTRENPQIGLLFVDFTRHRIGLHVNGTVGLVRDEQMRREHPDLPVEPVPGRRATLWVRITVQEAYIHCSKHIPHLVARPDRRAWGTDDVRRKGGDWFGAAEGRRVLRSGHGSSEAEQAAP